MKTSTRTICVASLLSLAGCASIPSGPSVMALPGSGSNFELFRAHDAECRRHAQLQGGGTAADQAATDAGVRSAVVGTVVGAVAGAAMGGHNGAGVGAGAGLLVGSMAGTEAAQSSGRASQRNYDNAYVQCMYAKGERVPLTADLARSRAQAQVERSSAVPPSPAYPPPPPSGFPPPPPPGYAAPPPGTSPPR